MDWSFLDGVYCISLQSRNDRTTSVARELHRVGLCRQVLFYRPVKHPTSPTRGVWESHRVVAHYARAQGQKTILILEDDVKFSTSLRPTKVHAVRKALRKLPSEWLGFYLGHWPLKAYFVDRHTVRTSSFCTHAYIASHRLIEWLCAHPYSKSITRAAFGGKGIDAAFAALPEMYAFFPMIATQSTSPSDHIRPSTVRDNLRDYIIHSRLRDHLLAHLMRPSEMLVAALSPLFRLWATLRVRPISKATTTTRSNSPIAADTG
ncbi:MAG: hypothetical protein U1F76_26740 [Candidatus Competibacteraceae bacterium]